MDNALRNGLQNDYTVENDKQHNIVCVRSPWKNSYSDRHPLEPNLLHYDDTLMQYSVILTAVKMVISGEIL